MKRYVYAAEKIKLPKLTIDELLDLPELSQKKGNYHLDDPASQIYYAAYSTDKDLLNDMIDQCSDAVLRVLMKRKILTPEMLDKAAHRMISEVNSGVDYELWYSALYDHRNLSEETMKYLIDSKYRMHSLVYNPKLSGHILEYMIDSSDSHEWSSAMSDLLSDYKPMKRKLTPELLDKLYARLKDINDFSVFQPVCRIVRQEADLDLLDQIYMDALNGRFDYSDEVLKKLYELPKFRNAHPDVILEQPVEPKRKGWPSRSTWENIDYLDEDRYERYSQKYLLGLEDAVCDELGVYFEISSRGEASGVAIFEDEDSGEQASINLSEFLIAELNMAASANSKSEYKSMFRDYVQSLFD